MRGGYGEPLAMLGYVVGLLITPLVGEWVVSAGVGGPVREVLHMCEVLFSVALLISLVRVVRRIVRAGRHAFVAARRE